MKLAGPFCLSLVVAGLSAPKSLFVARVVSPPPALVPAAPPAVLASAAALPDPEEQAARARARAFRLAQHRVHYTCFNGGAPDENWVTLTFDDGPDPEQTPRILDILKRERVPATFFVVGSKAEKYPEILRREAAEGHDLGNHTYHHYELPQLNPRAVRFEIERTNQAIEKALGGPTRWFRAPGCHYTTEALSVIQDLGMIRVDTTANSGDYAGDGVAPLLSRTLYQLAPGDVILCHDRMPETVEALPKLIHQIRGRGFRFVSLATLALHAQSRPRFQPPFWPRNEGIRIDTTRRPRLAVNRP